METIKLKNGQILKIKQDMFGESPRDWDNLAKMYCFHRRYVLGDKHNINPDNYESFQEMIEANTEEGDIVRSLYLYDHGMISISMSKFSCPWDSGMVGFIVATKKDIIENFGEYTEETIERTLKNMEGEVETYNQYLTGDVYGFELIEVQTCDLGHEHEEVIESCWGFYGTDFASNGLFEHAGIEQQDVA